MKNSIPIRNFWLICIILIPLAISALIFLDVDLFAKAPSEELDRLLRDMGVFEIPHTTQPIDIRLKDMNGNYVDLSDFRGKIVFLNFWTTWCPTCIVEMPSMEKLYRRFKDKDFEMVTINLQESASQVKIFFKKFKLSFTSLLDSTGEVGSWFAIRSIPTTFILDKEGRIIGKVLGPREWDSQKSISLFEHLIRNGAVQGTLKSAH